MDARHHVDITEGKMTHNNAIHREGIVEVGRRLEAIGLSYELTGRSAAYPVPGHILIKGTAADYYVFVRVARKKTQIDRSQRVLRGRVTAYAYERECWEANIGSHGQPIDPAPDFWAVVLASVAAETVGAGDIVLMIPHGCIEGQTLRVAEKGVMARWLIYADWSSLIAVVHRERSDELDVDVPGPAPRLFHPAGYRSPY
jgi:hypothetical protein